ncbi:hypothetical protein CLIM01_10482 [Colletotrichum limetticola]|uniref:Rhodopsin domain-containing protein n=1 Tax=Colletotrichum limetticola TaxID=1209924 RepID=A0ABQ9PJF9_9PEZI|nr:hypothetical protein CLIM01_10482 [Colletotrichum limetticola]
MNATNREAFEAVDHQRATESTIASILAIVTISHVLALVLVGLRIYARVIVVKQRGWDDLLIVVSAVDARLHQLCALGGWIMFVIQANYGLQNHDNTIADHDYMMFQKIGFWQSIISAGLAFMWLKISVALNLLRLSRDMRHRNWYKWTLWVMIGITAVHHVGGTLPFFLRCSPMEGYWNENLEPTPQCMRTKNFIVFSIVNTAFNISTDVVFATLPIPLVWSPRMDQNFRPYVIGILSIGYIAVVMGIIKSKYQLALEVERNKIFDQNIQVLGFVQLQLDIIAACAPALKPLVGKMIRLSSHGDTSNHGYDERSLRKNAHRSSGWSSWFLE